MLLYIILFASLILCGLLEVSTVSDSIALKRPARKKLLYSLIPVCIILFFGIFKEVNVGYDSDTYYTYYWSLVDRYSWIDLATDFSLDNGFFAVLKIIRLFTNDWWVARAILFVFTFVLYWKVILTDSPFPTVSLIIFSGLGMLGLLCSILRQALAGAITIFAYKQIRKGSWMKCLLFILLAATIHKTALCCIYMLIIYFLWSRRFNVIRLALLSGVSYLAVLVAIPLLSAIYANSRYKDGILSDGGYGMLLFIVVVLGLSMILFRMTNENNNKNLNYLFNLSSGALFIQMGALSFALWNRIAVYFSFYWCLLLPGLLARLSLKKRILFFLIIAVLFGFMFFYQLSDVDLFVLHDFHRRV
ncbi:MAG TPA: hypothetical protein DDW30_08710 [Clostridiales bacterium]|nr:hypothetical protein [Clostridiales bacterium]